MEHRVKPREPRRKVLIDARLRHERGWNDARILNISSRGLMVRAAQAPALGTYVEICRGTHRIVARVVWADDDRFGARAQDAIALDAIANGQDAPLAQAANLNDRRGWQRQPTSAEKHERSRRRSRQLEFLAVTAIGCLAAFFAFDTVQQVLARPVNLVEAALGAGR
jgi:hypothetical protein